MLAFPSSATRTIENHCFGSLELGTLAFFNRELIEDMRLLELWNERKAHELQCMITTESQTLWQEAVDLDQARALEEDAVVAPKPKHQMCDVRRTVIVLWCVWNRGIALVWSYEHDHNGITHWRIPSDQLLPSRCAQVFTRFLLFAIMPPKKKTLKRSRKRLAQKGESILAACEIGPSVKATLVKDF